MKNCPFCAEEIQDAAIKCKHCGEMLESRPIANLGSPAGALPADLRANDIERVPSAEAAEMSVENIPVKDSPQSTSVATSNATSGCAALTVGSMMGLTGMFIGFGVFGDFSAAMLFGLIGVGWTVAAAVYKPKAK